MKWYSIREFLDLKDVEDEQASHAPLPPEKRNPLAIRGNYEYHRPGSPLDRAK